MKHVTHKRQKMEMGTQNSMMASKDEERECNGPTLSWATSNYQE